MTPSSTATDIVIAAPRQEIVFLMDDVAGYQQLAASFAAEGREVVVLSAAGDGLAQIAQALAGRSGIEALHVISHGSADGLALGALTLGSTEVEARQPELAAIGRALAPDADVLLYGCNAGADAGLADALAIATGADVALSDDLTGAAALGGDWDLEVTSGSIETSAIVDAQLAAQWQEVLAITGSTTVSFNDFSRFSSAGAAYATNPNAVYQVAGNAAYQLVIDGALAGSATYAPNPLVYLGARNASSTETGVTLSFLNGQLFSASSLKFSNWGAYLSQDPTQTFVVRGYDSNGNQVGASQTITLAQSGTGTLNFSGLTEIQTLKITSATNGGNLLYFAIDDLVLTNVHPAAPSIALLSSPAAAGTYKVGDVIQIEVTFDQAVSVTGTPQLTLETGATDRVVNYTSGSGTSVLSFTYTVQAGDSSSDLDALSTAALSLNGGTIQSSSGTDAVLTLPTPGGLGSLSVNEQIVVDGVAPTVAIATSDPALKAGETATITFTFTEDPGASFTLGDVTVSGGTLGALAGSGLTRTAVFTPTAGTDAGTATISVGNGSYADAVGNTGSSGSLVFSVDTLAPAAPSAPDLQAGSDSGKSTSDNVTSDLTPTFSGTAEAGATVRLYDTDGTTVLGTTTADGSGNWVITSGSLGAGTHTVTARALDAAGNSSSASAGLSVTIDATAPAAPSTPDLAAASDSGASATDNITSDSTPTLTGSAEANATVRLYAADGVTVLGTTTAGNDGSWSITPTLVDGTHVLTVRAEDAAGNLGAASSPLTLVVDTTAPAAVLTADATGLKAGETATITFTFSEDPGASFTLADLTVSGGTLGALSGTGTTRTAVFTPDANTDGGSALISLAGGSYADTAGNIGGGASVALSFDTRAPAAPSAPDLMAGSDSGDSSTDDLTRDRTPTFTGTAEAGAAVTLYDTDGTTVLGSTTADGSGNWTITATTLGNGVHAVTARAVDAAGNASTASAALAVTIDASAPTVLTPPDLAAASDTGTSSTDDLTSAATPTLTGTTEANATVRLYASDGVTVLATTTAGNDGSWSFTPTLAEGTHVLTVRAQDAAGNLSGNSAPFVLTIDRTAPATTVASAALSADTGAVATDFITNTAAQTVSGTLAANLGAGEQVLVSFDNGSTWNPATSAAGSNTWSIAGTLASSGTLQVHVVDAAGNVGTTFSQDYVLDTGAPGVTLSSSQAALAAGETATITFTFTEDPGATFTNADIDVSGGTLGALSGTGLVRTATFTPDAATNGGIAGISIVAGAYQDLAGNSGAAGNALSLQFDTRAPDAPPAPDLQDGSDTGSSTSDNRTADNTPSFSGTAEANSTVTVFAGGVALGTVTADGMGDWTFTAAGLVDGGYAITTTATDAAGNTSAASAPLSVTIDTTAPAAPAQLTLQAASDTGRSATDGITSDDTPTVTGTAEAGATVRLYDANGRVLGTTTADGNGDWNITSRALAGGQNTLFASATDAAGNVSDASAALQLRVDLRAPATPSTPNLNASSDTGRSASDNITSERTPTLHGRSQPGTTVTLFDTDGTTVLGTADVDDTGTWSITSTALAQGSHSLTVRATDAAGNVSVSAGLDVVIDTRAPTAPAAPDLVASSDTGSSSSDDITNDRTPTFSGVAEAGALVRLYDTDGVTGLGTAIADSHGAWTITSRALAAGVHAFTVRATDVAGNLSTASPALEVRVTSAAVAATAKLASSELHTGVHLGGVETGYGQAVDLAHADGGLTLLGVAPDAGF